MPVKSCLPGVRVVDLGLGMSCALLTKLLLEAGASVVRMEPPEGDPFYDIYPAYRSWQNGKSLRHPDDTVLFAELAGADICVIGGEDYPGLERCYDARDLSDRFERLIVVDIARPIAIDDVAAQSVDLLVQASSGLVYEQKPDRPLHHTLLDPSYGAALQGLIGTLAALLERERSGRGQIVTTSLLQGTLAWRGMRWFQAARLTPKEAAVMPKGIRQLICQCADGQHLHFTKGGRGASLRLNNILGIHDDRVTVDTPSLNLMDGPDNIFGDLDLISSHVSRWESGALLAAFRENGITAERALAPGQCWDDPQVRHNRIIVSSHDGSRYVGCPISINAVSVIPAPDRDAPQVDAQSLPLSGIRILDLGSYVAGPAASRLLSDLGADVVKIEPMGGDPARLLMASFAAANRGKHAITIDLKTPQGSDILRKLCLECDIVQHNFRADVARRLGIDAPSLQRLKSDLIVLETTGYGASGPAAAQPAFDMVFQALCGHEYRFGGIGNRPEWNMFASIDSAAGMLGAIALLLALFKRAKSAEALALDVNLLNSGLYVMSELVQQPDGRFEGAAVNDRTQTGLHPAERLYEARDGWIAVAARTEEMAARFASVLDLGTPALGRRSAWGDEEAGRLADAIGRRTVAELVEALVAADVWVAKCRRDPERDLLSHPGLAAIGAVIATDDARTGATRQVGQAFNLSRSRLSLVDKAHVPALGEHSEQVLQRLGYSPADIADFYERKIVA